MHFVFRITIVFSMLLTFSNCFGAQSKDDLTVTEQQKLKIYQEMFSSTRHENFLPSYIVGPGDVLSVTMFEEGNMSALATEAEAAPTGITVMLDGRISLKEVGDVLVAGLTLQEICDFLKKLYSPIYTHPIITTTLIESHSLRYTVLGEVKNPRVYPLQFPMKIVQVIAEAGGFTEWADKEVVVVRETISPELQPLFTDHALEFDYGDFLSGKDLEKNISIQSGDVVVVK